MAFSEKCENQNNNAQKSKPQQKESMHAQFTNYIQGRLEKLDEQVKQHCLDSSQNAGGHLSTIFEGVSVYIDGYTDPSSDVLREIVVGGGGRSIHWFSKTTVTHVIATSLARTKILHWGSGVKICRPEWITESCKANQLLPWLDYRLVPEGGPSSSNENTIEQAFRPQTTSPQTKKAGDDGFISDFYGNSRLHHLSDWRMKLRTYVAERQKANESNSFPQLDSLLNDAPTDGNEFAAESLIMHIDLDCFFVSAGLLSHPHLVGQAVVVTHSQGKKNASPNSKGAGGGMSYSEIASCSYEARAMGVRNGMLLGHAQQLCPNLVHIPYEFDKYDEISHIFYDILLAYTNDIEPVSCDEAYVDLSSVLQKVRGRVKPDEIVSAIRKDVFELTGCRCSAGVGKNRLVARLCTRRAKPNGQFLLIGNESVVEHLDDFIARQQIADLPGVGHVMINRLHSNFGEHIATCADLQMLSLDQLTSIFGPRTGQFLYDSCRGICQETGLKAPEIRKSVSAEINYGMRFTDISEVKKFLGELVDEVVKRLNEAGLKGQQVHLKLRLRSQDAPKETKKFLGHGLCDAFSKSTRLDSPCNTAGPILTACSRLLFGSSGNGLGEFGKFDMSDVRGMGIQLTKLVEQTVPSGNKNALMKAFANAAKTGVKRSRPLEQERTPILRKTRPKLQQSTSPPKSLRRVAQTAKAQPRPTLIGVSTLPEVCSLIDEWLVASPSPCAEDLEMIVGYFNEVIDYGDLGHVYDVLRFMRNKLGNSDESCHQKWLTAFEQIILYSVKQKVKTVYGQGAEIPLI